MKKFAQKNCRKMFLEAIFFAFEKTFFRVSVQNFLSLLYMISLAYKISHCLSANPYQKLRCVIYTGVTLFALVLHLNCTALSQSESSNFFMCIITHVNAKPPVSLKCLFTMQFNEITMYLFQERSISWRVICHGYVLEPHNIDICNSSISEERR